MPTGSDASTTQGNTAQAVKAFFESVNAYWPSSKQWSPKDKLQVNKIAQLLAGLTGQQVYDMIEDYAERQGHEYPPKVWAVKDMANALRTRQSDARFSGIGVTVHCPVCDDEGIFEWKDEGATGVRYTAMYPCQCARAANVKHLFPYIEAREDFMAWRQACEEAHKEVLEVKREGGAVGHLKALHAWTKGESDD